VWAIFLYYVITLGMGLILQLEMLLGVARFPPEQQALIGSMSTAERLFGIGVAILTLAAATALWRLRKVALPLFSCVFVLSLGTIAWQLQPGGLYSKIFAQGVVMTGVMMFSVGVGVLMSVAIWSYVLHLWRVQVLK
jgi:hypothetical protein